MASGKNHDNSTIIWSIPFTFATIILFDLNHGLISGFGFLIGGLWLSPDLDTNSLALKRWGVLKAIWFPYRKFIRHRSILSHGPLIGTSLRITYIALILSLILYTLKLFNLNILNLAGTFSSIKSQFMINYKIIIYLLIGLEGSAWLHIIKDGDPLPIEFKRLIRWLKAR